MLAALGAFGWWQRDFPVLRMVPLVLAGWLIAVGVTLRSTGAWGFDYAIWFGLGLMLRLVREPVACAVATVATYLVAYVGLQRSLARFPWEGVEERSPLYRSLTQRDQTRIDLGSGYGWPFDRLRPKFPPHAQVRLADAVLISLLAGWWLHVIGALISPLDERGADLFMTVHFVVLLVLAMSRLAVYCAGHVPPISLLGRLRTGRWIIPGYDKVLLAPLGVLAVAVVVPGLVISRWGVALEYGLPFALALGVFVALGAGPSLIAWRLTGNHRIVAWVLVSNQQGGFIKVG